MRLFADIARIRKFKDLHGFSTLGLAVDPALWAAATYRYGNFWSRHPIPVLSQCALIPYAFAKFLVEVLWGISISRHATIGPGFYIQHFSGIFIHTESVLGKNCIVSQGVSIGIKGAGVPGAPRIGDDVYIAAGAKVFGPVTIGHDVIIGANSVVTQDVPDTAVVVGVPGAVIRTGNVNAAR